MTTRRAHPAAEVRRGLRRELRRVGNRLDVLGAALGDVRRQLREDRASTPAGSTVQRFTEDGVPTFVYGALPDTVGKAEWLDSACTRCGLAIAEHIYGDGPGPVHGLACPASAPPRLDADGTNAAIDEMEGWPPAGHSRPPLLGETEDVEGELAPTLRGWTIADAKWRRGRGGDNRLHLRLTGLGDEQRVVVLGFNEQGIWIEQTHDRLGDGAEIVADRMTSWP